MVMTAARANAAAEQRALAQIRLSGLQGMGAAPAHQGTEWHRDDWGRVEWDRVEWDRAECGGRGVGRCRARRGGLAGMGGVACQQ